MNIMNTIKRKKERRNIMERKKERNKERKKQTNKELVE